MVSVKELIENNIWPTITIGQLIDTLKSMSLDKQVVFSFCDLRPTYAHSYRGYYDHLAFSYGDIKILLNSELLSILDNALREKFEGYKGGDFYMHRATPVWVDNYDKCTGTTIIDVVEEEYSIVLVTGRST